MEDFEQVKVVAFEKKEFTNSDGKKSEWWRCEGQSHNNGTFCFSRPITEDIKIGDIYGMYLSKDKYFKAVVNYHKA